MKRLFISFICIILFNPICVAISFEQLIPFDKHWDDKMAFKSHVFDSVTDIACPQCGHRIHANYSIALTSNPIQYHAWCPLCGWRGYI